MTSPEAEENMFEVKLNEILKEKNMSIVELSEITGIHSQRLREIARNDFVQFQINEIDILCNVLEKTPSQIFVHKK